MWFGEPHPFPERGEHLPDWARRDNKVTKGDRVQYIVRLSNLLKPTGHAMHQQFNIQQLYALPTLYLCVLYLSENKQRLVPLTA